MKFGGEQNQVDQVQESNSVGNLRKEKVTSGESNLCREYKG